MSGEWKSLALVERSSIGLERSSGVRDMFPEKDKTMPVAEIEALDALQQLYGDINALIEHFLDKYEHAISTDHYSAICDMLETVDEERTVLQDETNELD